MWPTHGLCVGLSSLVRECIIQTKYFYLFRHLNSWIETPFVLNTSILDAVPGLSLSNHIKNLIDIVHFFIFHLFDLQVCYCQPGYTGEPSLGCTLIDFCASGPCGPGAHCDNSRGSYKCLCPLETVGDPYRDGCKPPVECEADLDCPPATKCVKDNGVPKCKGQ